MSRTAGLVNWMGKSARGLGPLDAVFALSDYAGGKQEGEDDIRAGVGASGSVLGGWGGASAGAMGGAALGSVVPGVGTVIGGAIGAIAGGIGGGYLGGWGADRADEAIRGDAGLKKQQDNKGNKNMGRKYFDESGNYIGEDDGSVGEFLQNNATGAAAVATSAYGAKKLADTFAQNQPFQAYKTAVAGGIDPRDAARAVGSDLISEPFMRNAGKIIKPLAIATGLSAADDLLLGGGVKRAAGNFLGGAVDMATGGRTNLDGNERDSDVRAAERQQRYQQTAGLAQSNAALAEMRNNPNNRFIEEANDKAYNRQKQDYWQQYDRERDDSLENSRYNLSANLGKSLMDNWYNSADRVNNAMATIGRASFL
jgi:hypothetical protein